MSIVLIATTAFVVLLIQSINEFLEYSVVTEYSEMYSEKMTLPALTLCVLLEVDKQVVINKCEIRGFRNCSISDFEMFHLKHFDGESRNLTCHKINGGKNSTGHEIDLIETKNFGVLTGYRMDFVIPSKKTVFYSIGENSARPVSSELKLGLSSKENLQILLPKLKISEKLGRPYNQCQKNLKNINDYDSKIYRELIESKLKYRQINCLELCQYTYSNTRNSCLEECPLECDSNIYDVELISSVRPIFQLEDVKYNLSKVTVLRLVFRFDNFLYSTIKQIPKTSGAVLFSNIGGLAGLFLGFSLTSLSGFLEILLQKVFNQKK